MEEVLEYAVHPAVVLLLLLIFFFLLSCMYIVWSTLVGSLGEKLDFIQQLVMAHHIPPPKK